MGPRTQTVDKRNQATPLTEDLVKILQGELAAGAFGTGVGPLQRGAGSAIDKYVQALQTRATQGVNTASQVGGESEQLMDALTRRSAVNTNRSAADQREAFGAAGARFGSSLGNAESLLRAESGMNLDQVLGEILVGEASRKQAARQFDINADLGINAALLQGIGQMFSQGQAAIDPFVQLAGAGIVNPEVIASPGIGDQLISGGLQGLGAFLGMPGGIDKIFSLFGGGGGGIPNAPPMIPLPDVTVSAPHLPPLGYR